MSLNYKLEALYHFNGDVTDSSGNGNDGTNNGVTFTTDKEGKLNSAGNFDGNSYVGTSLNRSSSSLSYCLWVKTTFSDGDSTFISEDDCIFNFEPASGGNWIGIRYSGATLWDTRDIDTINDGNWHLVIITVGDTSSPTSTTNLYIDGVNQGSPPLTSSGSINSTTSLNISRDISAFDGIIDEVRIYSRALTETEITQLFVGFDTEKNQVGTLNHGLVFGSHFNNGTATDWTGNGNNGTVNGATATTDRNGNPDSALSFDGGNNWIDMPNNVFNPNNDFTIIAWINISSDDNDNWILSNSNSAESSYWGFINRTNTNSGLCFQYNTGGGTIFPVSSESDSVLSTDGYSLVGLTRRGDTWELYRDGFKVAEGTDSVSNLTLDRIQDMGRLNWNTDQYFHGDLDEPRIYSRALSPVEHLMLYKGYDSEQNSQDTFDIDLVYGSHFNNGTATDFSGNGNDGTVNGATATTDKNGVTSQALIFDGSNDRINIPYQPLSLNQLSAAIWIKHNNTSARQSYINLWNGTSNIFYMIYNDNGNGLQASVLSGTIITNESIDTSWHLYTLSWDGSTVSFYEDENVLGTASESGTTPSSATGDTLIGDGVTSGSLPAYPLNAKSDEPRIYTRKLFQDEVIEYTYSYDTPTMLDDDLLVGVGVKTNSLGFAGGL